MSRTEQDGLGSQRREAIDPEKITEVRQLPLGVVKLTDVGRLRPHNEDYVDSFEPPDPRQRARKGAIYLVADGMGGHQAGEVASQGAVEMVIDEYYRDTTHDIGTSLVRAFRLANQRLYEQAQADASKAGMGTTLVAAVILDRKVYVANVGDSRAYLINDSGITQITEDHSWVDEQVRAGLLTPEQARRHPQRNLVTRALGSRPAVQVDLFEGEIKPADTLLLCTDGLTGQVTDAEIAEMVLTSPADEAARQLIALANERGGSDNSTVLIVRLVPDQVPVAAPVPPKSRPALARFLSMPALIGLAVVLLLILVGLVAAPLLFDGRPTPAPTAVPVTSSPTWTLTAAVGVTPPSPSPSAEPSATLMPTATAEQPPSATAETPGVMPTESATPSPSATEESSVTVTPSLTVTTAFPAGSPSVEITGTAQPTLTLTLTPTGTLTVSPSATP